VDRLDVLDLLGSLVNKSLVLAEQNTDALRYRLLETIRQFALDRLMDAGSDEVAAVKAAHWEHFLSVAEEASVGLTVPDQGRWFARLDADRSNLLLAAQYAASSAGSTRQALYLSGVLRRYWMSRDAGAEAKALFRSVLERPDARADLRVFVAAAIHGIEVWRADSAEAAFRLGAETIEFARQVGEPALLIEVLSQYCGLFYGIGKSEQGNPFGAEAVELARHTGDDVLLGVSMMHYLLCRDRTNPEDGERLYAEAFACTERSGDRLFGYLLHNNAGVHALRAGDFATARIHLQQAAQASAEIGEQSHHVAVNMGWVLRHEDDPRAAQYTFESALRLSRRMGERHGLAYCTLGLACVAGDLGDWHRAAELHGAAQAFLDRVDQPWEDPEGRYRQESIDAIRAQAGTERFDAAYRAGTALTFDDAVALALSSEVQEAA
jgi:tetratricopeptide (TPR) repeat protein